MTGRKNAGQGDAAPSAPAQAAGALRITRGTTVAQAVAAFPAAQGILLSHGLHCAGCAVSAFESIEDGCIRHGMSGEEIDSLLEELNRVAAGQPPVPSSPVISVTPAAVDRLAAMQKSEGKAGWGVRVVAVAGQKPSGPDFELDFEKEQSPDDLVSSFCGHDCLALDFFVAKKILPLVSGAVIDFRESVQSSGFSIKKGR